MPPGGDAPNIIYVAEGNSEIEHPSVFPHIDSERLFDWGCPWFAQMDEGVIVHESVHLFGIYEDRYGEDLRPLPGYENYISGNPNAVFISQPAQAEIDEIIDLAVDRGQVQIWGEMNNDRAIIDVRRQLTMSQNLKGLERYTYLSSSDAPLSVSKLRNCLGNPRSLIFLGFGLALLSGLIAIAWYVFGAVDQTLDSKLDHLAYLCRVLFPVTIGIESLSLLLITPAIAVIAFADRWKKEAGSLVQGVPAHRLVVKGVASAMARALLIPLTAIPLEIVALLPHGISITDTRTLLSEQVVFFVTALTLSAAGLLFSSARSWSRWAVKTYGTVFLVTTGPLLVAFPLQLLLPPALTSPTRYQMAYLIWLASPILLNPVVAALLTTEPSLNVWRTVYADTGHRLTLAPFWFVYTVVSLVITAIFLLVTARRLHRHTSEHQSIES